VGDLNATVTSGVYPKGYREGATATDPWVQYVAIKEDKIVSYHGRSTTFVTPGRAAIAQKIFAIHNATASTVLVSVDRITIDVLSTALKAATVLPPLIRMHRFTALPTGGTALAKATLDTAGATNAAVTLWGDSSADNNGAGTSSATTLTVTALDPPLSQKYGPRFITLAGYEPIDTAPFFYGESDVTLRALEGMCVFLNMATVTTGNPATDKWVVSADWTEFTRP